MDVTCTRCGTEYEFEEAAISSAGMTVKCTDCGHLFKVQREVETAPVGASGWMIRHPDGSITTLESFSDLTRLIRDSKIILSDELSRTGRAWKRLEDIEELASLFPAVGDGPPGRPPRPRRATPDLGLAQRPPPVTAREPGGRTSDPPASPRTASPMAVDATPEASAAAFARAQAPARRPPSSPPEEAEPIEGGTAEGGASLPDDDASTTARHARQVPDADLGHAETLARRTGQPLRWLAILLPLAFAGWGALWLFESHTPAPKVSDVAPQHLALALAALDAHRTRRFDQAIAGFEQALALHPDDPHVLSGLSRVYAVWAQNMRFQVQGLGPTKGSHAPGTTQIGKLAAQAKAHAERAAQRNPGHEGAGVALADALRLSGNLVGARAELDRARANEGVPEAETLRVAALLAADEAGGDLSAGRALAEQAVAQDPASIRCRELLAWCLIAEGDLEGARLHMDAIARSEPDHPVLARLSKAIRQAQAGPPAKQPEPAPAAMEAEALESAASPTTNADTPQEPKRRARTEPGSPTSVEELVSTGEAALERGATAHAARAFQKALAADPSSARARTGLGYVALERGRPLQAIQRFRPAMAQGHPEAYIGLGDAYRRLGRMREALTAYKRYLKRFPKGSARTIARRQIELLEEQIAEAESLSPERTPGTGEAR